MAAKKLNAHTLRARLKVKNLQLESALSSHHPIAHQVFQAANVRPGKLRSHAKKLITSGVTAASIMLPPAAGVASTVQALPEMSIQRPFTPHDAQQKIHLNLEKILPFSNELTPQVENQVSQLLYENLGIHAYAELDGNRLNYNFGYIGAEQHLPRYPGDTVAAHGQLIEKGITPGRGAWGYFASSKSALTPEMIEKEKYYFAVQTLYLPDWNTRLPYLREWYKHRKMVAVNPKNGKAVVGVVADSGPAWWTGKQFGGSPEIMDYLNMFDGKQKGKILLFFVDDPDNKVPLGPLEYNLENPPLVLAS